MAGHSKWNNIKHRKEASDTKKAKVYTKIGREVALAVRESGADPVANTKLRDIIAKARANNIPNDNINRMIQKASGADNAETYEAMSYEGYGPGGVAVIVETLTDNRNRTAGEMRHYFDKNGGSLGVTNCVSWSFQRRGVLLIEEAGQDEEAVLMAALEAGAADCTLTDGMFEIMTEPETFSAVREALEAGGYVFADAEIKMLPQTYVALSDETDIKHMRRLLDMMEDNDDVQSIWHNWEEDDNG